MFMLDNTWSCFLAKPTGGHRLLLLCPNENLRSLCCECACVSDVITDTSLRSKHQHGDGRLWCSAPRNCFRLVDKWGFLWGEGSELCPVQLLQVARSSRLVWFLFSVVFKNWYPASLRCTTLFLPSQGWMTSHQRRTKRERESWVCWEKCQTRCSVQPADALLVTVRNRWAHNYINQVGTSYFFYFFYQGHFSSLFFFFVKFVRWNTTNLIGTASI